MARRAVILFFALTTQASVTNALSVKASRSFDGQDPRRSWDRPLASASSGAGINRRRTPTNRNVKLDALEHPSRASPIGVEGVEAFASSPLSLQTDKLLPSPGPTRPQRDSLRPVSPRSAAILETAKKRPHGDLPAVKAPRGAFTANSQVQQPNSLPHAASRDLYASVHAPRGPRFDGTRFGQTDDAYKNSNANEVCRSPGRGESKCDGPRERNHFEFGTASHDDYAAIGSEQLNCHHATVITSDARNGMWDDVDRLLVANPSLTEAANNFFRTDGLPVVRTPDRKPLSSTWHGEPLSPAAEKVDEKFERNFAPKRQNRCRIIKFFFKIAKFASLGCTSAMRRR